MKPKLSQPTGVCCYCVLSESHCNSTSGCPLFSPLCVFSCGIFLFISFLGSNLFFCDSFVFFSIFSTFSLPQIHVFTPMWPLSLPRGSHLWGKKQQHSFGRLFMCLCFHTKLLWYFEAFQGLFSNFYGAFYQNLSKSEKGEHKASQCTWKDQGKKGKLCDFHNPYLETRWGLTTTSETSCQQPIEASSSDCFLSQKTSEGNLASYWNWRVSFIVHPACGFSN